MSLRPVFRNVIQFALPGLATAFALAACSSQPAPQVRQAAAHPDVPVAVSASQAVDGLPVRYTDVTYPEFHYVAPDPLAFRVALSDSITGYLVPDRSLPLVTVSLYFRENGLPAKPQETALLEQLSGLYRRGGAQGLPAALLDDSLEFLSAALGGQVGNSQSVISMNCLSRDVPAVLAMLRQVFNQPAMDSLRLELNKAASQQALAHRFDQPAAQLSALSAKALYNTHPALWDPTAAEISAVTRAQLLARAPAYFQPRRVVFAVAGDFNADSMKVALQTLFADWKKPSGPLAPLPELTFRNKPGVYLSDKAITQANIRMAQPFVKRPHPDYYPAMVASYILGGSGFTSRLTEKVRSDEGLAYSVYSFTDSDYDDVGTAGVALQTKVASAPYALSIIRREILRLAQEGPTPAELAGAKKALIESLPGMFDSPSATADAFARSEMWGRKPDHFKEYPAKITAVDADQVKAMIAKYFEPSRMTISIVGPATALQARDSVHQVSLSDFGSITLVPTDSLLFR